MAKSKPTPILLRPLDVTDASHDRAVVIFDGVLLRVRERGFELKTFPDALWRGTFFEKSGCLVKVYVRETTKRQPATGGWQKYVFLPTGRLVFHSKGGSGSKEIQWADGRRLLEDRLDEIAAGVEKQYLEMANWERERAEHARAAAEEAERAAEARRKQEDEKARFAELVGQVESWELSCRIKTFVDDVERRVLAARGTIEPDAERWIRWAREQGERLDPVKKGP